MWRAPKPSNEAVLQRLKDGTAEFEIVRPHSTSLPITGRVPFFARKNLIWDLLPAMKKREQYSVQKVIHDDRCIFRAVAKGLENNKGITLSPHQENERADELWMIVKESICSNKTGRFEYEEAIKALRKESLDRYCERIEQPEFLGGEFELSVLSKLCRQHIIVYIQEDAMGLWGSDFVPIGEHGKEFGRASKMPVRLLCSGANRYDLLV